MLCGTQPIISISALELGVDIMARADILKIREKSKKMGDLFMGAVEQKCADCGFGIASPRNADERGSQVSSSGRAATTRRLVNRSVGRVCARLASISKGLALGARSWVTSWRRI